ncbi:hypothetical protein QBC37DRAFT_281573 [Rhypophila decipiens]|uniref:Uncharacterized protein n=1 Tax=Rhypophila decipiens TaxID=261697 RepID=A0AAN6YBF7_9PEZI|nr:hypothetical protein QBC37DRAFT_281573 [Rhypophila decipiens]
MNAQSSSKVRSNPFAAQSSPELLHQLGKAVLSYSMKRLGGQGTSSKTKSTERQTSASRYSKGRDKDDDGTGTTVRSDSSTDLHHILAQVAVGLFGYGIRQYLHRRKLSKQRAATAKPPRQERNGEDFGSGGGVAGNDDGQSSSVADPELAAALESITADLQGTSKAIRKLAGRTPAHECDVHERLKNEADAIREGLERVQASVNNVRNLHGGLRTAAKVMPPGVDISRGVHEVKVPGGDGERRRARKDRGHRINGYSEHRVRDRNKRPKGFSREEEREGDDGRISGMGGGGYRHSSRLYSRRDRDGEEMWR